MAVVVYDITSSESFDKAQYWVKVSCKIFYPLMFLSDLNEAGLRLYNIGELSFFYSTGVAETW